MRKLFIIMLIIAMSMAMLVGCNNENNEVVSEVTSSVKTESETVSGEGTNVASEEDSEVVSEEMTIEEKILAEMPAKMEVPEGYEPVHVTKEMILERYEKIKLTEGYLTQTPTVIQGVTRADSINDTYMCALLVLNYSYMDPAEFNILFDEYFEPPFIDKHEWYKDDIESWGMTDVDILRYEFEQYRSCIDNNSQTEVPWGEGYSSVTPDELLFDPYLIRQAEQINYLMYNMQMDEENQESYYRIIESYLYYDQNEYLTFDYDYDHTYGSGLAALQCVAQSGQTYDCALTYNYELVSQYWETEEGRNVFIEVTDDFDAVLDSIE